MNISYEVLKNFFGVSVLFFSFLIVKSFTWWLLSISYAVEKIQFYIQIDPLNWKWHFSCFILILSKCYLYLKNNLNWLFKYKSSPLGLITIHFWFIIYSRRFNLMICSLTPSYDLSLAHPKLDQMVILTVTEFGNGRHGLITWYQMHDIMGPFSGRVLYRNRLKVSRGTFYRTCA